MSPFEDLVAAIEQRTGHPGRRNGKHIRLLCPAHDDHHPSLDVADAGDGTALVTCRSHGCTYEQVLAAVGVEPADLHRNGDDDGEWTPHGPAVAVYRYLDEQRRLLFEVCRTADKQFPQRRPDPTAKNGWRWKLEGVRRVLYRLPELLAAIERGDTVYLVEGEKDADRLTQLGVTATCNPGGAGNWDNTYAHALAGATVVIVADRDLAGYRHARQVARSLEAANAHITLRQAAVDQAGADTSDHLAAGHTLNELEPLNHTDGEPFRLLIRTATQILALPDPPDDYQLLGPLVFRGARTIIVGDTGHGKTSLALQIVGAILKGEEMLGYQGSGVGPALVVDLEQGIRSIKRGLREAGLEKRDDVLYVTIPDGLALDRDEEHYAALDAALAEHRPAILLLDPFYKAHRADDPNAERPIIDLMRQLDALRTAYEFALILPAHPRKDIAGREGARKLTIHDVAGSGAATRGAEIVLGLERLGHGYARLRYLKDRDGDLPVGDAVSLLYSKDEGFRLDPRDDTSDEAIQQKVLAAERDWMTVEEWRKELKVRAGRMKSVLEGMTAAGTVAFMVGPSGRSPKAQCYATSPGAWEESGRVDESLFNSGTHPTHPTSLKEDEGWDESEEPREDGNSQLSDNDDNW